MKFFLTSFCFLATFVAFHAENSMGPVGNVVINSIYSCKEKPAGDEIDVQAEIRTIDGKGNKAMYANFTNKIPIDQTIEFVLDVLKWESGGWKQYYNVKGKFCVEVQKLLPKIWGKMRAAAKPAVPLPCPIKPGKYVMDKFQAATKDITIPAIFYGKFMVKLQVIKAKKLIMCLHGEGDSQAP